MNSHIYCCCGDVGCVLPGKSDTITISFQSTNSCAGCYDNYSSSSSVSEINVNIDGSYTLSWAVDSGGIRLFAVHNQAVVSGELRVHESAGCTGVSTLLSNGKLSAFASFNIATGCMVRASTDLNQAGDIDSYVPFSKSGTDLALDVWHSTAHACGDEASFGLGTGGGTAISSTTQAKVSID